MSFASPAFRQAAMEGVACAPEWGRIPEGRGMRGKGAMRLTRSGCRRLGENRAPFVIPAQAGIQRGRGDGCGVTSLGTGDSCDHIARPASRHAWHPANAAGASQGSSGDQADRQRISKRRVGSPA